MASVITATNSSGLTTSADNSGVLQLASGTGNLVTIPSVTGTAMVSGNMPAFSAYAGSPTSLSNSANTVLIYDGEDFDTASCYNNTGSTVGGIPAYSFRPNVAGYYQINATHYVGYAGGSSNMAFLILKNGSNYLITTGVSGSSNVYMQAATLVYCNGTSDYISMAVYWTGSGASTGNGLFYKFQGYLARAA